MDAPAPISLRTDDGVRLSARHWPRAPARTGCVIAHGFTGHSGSPRVRAICSGLNERGFGVLAPDLRGHGGSAGLCTAGDAERFDVAAAVAWMRSHGYGQVAVLGWSMGGSAVLRYAGLGGDPDAVVSVSSPGMWFERGTRPMRLVHWMFETRSGRLACRVVRRTRIASAGWSPVPAAPAEVVADIAAPLLLVHGEDDGYFPVRHVQAMAEAAPAATLWVEAGMGHAETATTPELLARIAGWLADVLPPPGRSVAPTRSHVCDDERRDTP